MGRHGVVLDPVEPPPARFGRASSPLLEKEIDSFALAGIPDVEDPSFLHGPRAGAGLAADDDPGYSPKIDIPHGFQQRFDGEEPNCGGRRPKMLNARGCPSILNGHAAPDMRGRRALPVSAPQVCPHERAAFREHLEHMPVGGLHGVEDAVDEIGRDLLVEQVAHRIDEDPPRPFPRKRLGQPLRAPREVESVLEGMAGRAAKPLREALGVAVVAAARDLRAARHRVPRRVRPLDGGSVAHTVGPCGVPTESATYIRDSFCQGESEGQAPSGLQARATTR